MAYPGVPLGVAPAGVNLGCEPEHLLHPPMKQCAARWVVLFTKWQRCGMGLGVVWRERQLGYLDEVHDDGLFSAWLLAVLAAGPPAFHDQALVPIKTMSYTTAVPAPLFTMLIRSAVAAVTVTPAPGDTHSNTPPGPTGTADDTAVSHGTPLVAGRVTCTSLVLVEAAITRMALSFTNRTAVPNGSSSAAPCRSRESVADGAMLRPVADQIRSAWPAAKPEARLMVETLDTGPEELPSHVEDAGV